MPWRACELWCHSSYIDVLFLGIMILNRIHSPSVQYSLFISNLLILILILISISTYYVNFHKFQSEPRGPLTCAARCRRKWEVAHTRPQQQVNFQNYSDALRLALVSFLISFPLLTHRLNDGVVSDASHVQVPEDIFNDICRLLYIRHIKINII